MVCFKKKNRDLKDVIIATINISLAACLAVVHFFLLRFILVVNDVSSFSLLFFVLCTRNKMKFFKTFWKTKTWFPITSFTLINSHFSNFILVTKYASFLFVSI
jgi:type IV secretory pathway VirB3-like protein